MMSPSLADIGTPSRGRQLITPSADGLLCCCCPKPSCGCWLPQAQQERDDVLDRLNLLDMQLTAMTSHNSDLSAALEAQRQRGAELEAALAARDRVGTNSMMM